MNPLTWIPKLKIWAIAFAVLVATLIGTYYRGKIEGESKVEGDLAKETVKRVDAGAKGAASARKAQDEGRDPEAGVRSRDGHWQ